MRGVLGHCRDTVGTAVWRILGNRRVLGHRREDLSTAVWLPILGNRRELLYHSALVLQMLPAGLLGDVYASTALAALARNVATSRFRLGGHFLALEFTLSIRRKNGSKKIGLSRRSCIQMMKVCKDVVNKRDVYRGDPMVDDRERGRTPATRRKR